MIVLQPEIIGILQMLLALSLGLLLGLERTLAGRMAGMRTYALVSLGSCLFILVAGLVSQNFPQHPGIDPLRVAAGIVMGIGFLCGGLIVFKDDTISGLTTAAGIWVATGIGMAVGYKLYAYAIAATLLTLFVLSGLWYIEQHIRKFYKERPRKNAKA